MEQKIFEAALAGLLHDVGKIGQRAGENGTRQWDDQAKGDFGYKHALLTSDFVETHLPAAWKGPVKNAASSHHRPHTRLDYALALADRLSAGERDPSDDGKAAQPKQMLSIFCDVTADGQKAPRDACLPLGPLAMRHEALFPGPAWDDARVDQGYQALWSELDREARGLKLAYDQGGDQALYLENWLLLLQRLAWSVPSAYYKTRPDISLYDHSRMTAALAALFVGGSLNDADLAALANNKKPTDRPLALLVGGDLSGVQAFIYTITARGAVSALRGRSFYLQVLTEALARFLLRSLDLPITNLIYAAGGHFYLLARPEDAPRLAGAQKAISQTLFTHHRGDLYLAAASLPLKAADFQAGRLSQHWADLGRAVEQAKQHRFSELGGGIVHLFEPQGHGGNLEKQCQVCGVEHADTRIDDRSVAATDEGKVRKCPNCFGFEDLGHALRRAACLALEHGEIPPPPSLEAMGEPGDWQEVLASLGLAVRILAEDELGGYSLQKPTTLLALDDTILTRLARLRTSASAVGRRLLVNTTPVLRPEDISRLTGEGVEALPSAGHIMPFDALEAQSRGIHRLGVLRMDMDNLGRLFSEGLGNLATLSRVATLSHAVSLYFEGWVEVLAEESNRQDRTDKMGDRVYSIYSGGDDLFFVGAWDGLVELSRRIRSDLTDYAAGHPGVHASAGLVLVGGKYPLAQAAEDAHRAEEQAKAYVRWEGGEARRKDAICFLGQAIDWHHFGLQPCSQTGLQSAHSLMHLLLEHKGPTQTPLIRRLIGLHERYQEAQEKRVVQGEDTARNGNAQTLWGPWNWLASYYLFRLYNQHKQDAFINDLRQALKESNFSSIEWTGLAARWAELMLR